MKNKEKLLYKIIEEQKYLETEINAWEGQKMAVQKRFYHLWFDLKIWLIILCSGIVPIIVQQIFDVLIYSEGGILDYGFWAFLTLFLSAYKVIWLLVFPFTAYHLTRSVLLLYWNRPTKDIELLIPEEDNRQIYKKDPHEPLAEPTYQHELSKLKWGLTKYYHYANELKKLLAHFEGSTVTPKKTFWDKFNELEQMGTSESNSAEASSVIPDSEEPPEEDTLASIEASKNAPSEENTTPNLAPNEEPFEITVEKTLASIKYYRRPVPANPFQGAMAQKASDTARLGTLIGVLMLLVVLALYFKRGNDRNAEEHAKDQKSTQIEITFTP